MMQKPCRFSALSLLKVAVFLWLLIQLYQFLTAEYDKQSLPAEKCPVRFVFIDLGLNQSFTMSISLIHVINFITNSQLCDGNMNSLPSFVAVPRTNVNESGEIWDSATSVPEKCSKLISSTTFMLQVDARQRKRRRDVQNKVRRLKKDEKGQLRDFSFYFMILPP